jgi:hypothetical protein
VKVAQNFGFGRSHLGFVSPPLEKPTKFIQYPADPSKTQKNSIGFCDGSISEVTYSIRDQFLKKYS